ncbi:NAD(P)-binding protein [Auriscalpium vulgare]|uniref:NAD(P)-binding protein n=1 Tax=Auriscalpium vulgare TaxID=40419 RepID=A0ACB8RVH5_9AGAM|nr:NAD(P)-binding protein [Auriscalpium vulgare]
MATQRPIVFRWGIISTGHIATVFVKDLLVDPQTRGVADVVHKVAAVGSRTVESAQQFINKVAGGDTSIQGYGSYAEVYADPNVDAVYIGTPHTFHYVNAVDAIKAKKHVLVEKPATTNLAELHALLALAKEHGVFLMEAMWTRFQPVALAVRRIIDEGSLGAPIMVHADLSSDFDLENIPKTNRILDPLLGGGALLDLGPYPLVWAIIALYELPANNRGIPSVSSSMVKTPLTGVDANTAFTLNFPAIGAQALLSCNINIPGVGGPGAVLRFRNGNILIPTPIFHPKSYTVQWFDKPGSGVVEREETVKSKVVGGGWHFQADEVARCVSAGKTESEIWGHDKALLAMAIFDEVRAQGGYVLPDGVEKVL